MTGEARSLLTFLPAPVAVGDPDGRAVYVNPAFQARFDVAPGEVRGRPLAELFVGGGREAVLQATARVCAEGGEARFRLREDGRGYAVVAAPIVAERQTVGLVFLFCEESAGEERLLAFHREVAEPLAELSQCLDAMLEQTGGRRAARFRTLVEEGIRAVDRIQKWTDELAAAVRFEPEREPSRRLDPLGLTQNLAEALGEPMQGAGHELELLLPARLPRVRGDGDRLALALERFVQERMAAAPRGTAFTLAAKLLAAERCVLLSLTETAPPHAARFDPDDEAPPAELERVLRASGGAVARIADPVAGVTTTLRLPLA